MVLPALKLSNMNAGILIMMQQVRLMMFSLWGGVVVAHEILVSAQGPFLGLGLRGLGPGLDNKPDCHLPDLPWPIHNITNFQTSPDIT